MKKKTKIVFLSTAMTVSISIASIILGILIFYMGRYNGHDTLAEMMKDPLWLIVAWIPVVLLSLATMYFIVTDEGIRFCWLCFIGKQIRFEDILEIGYFMGEPYRIRKIPKVTYISYKMPDGNIKYDFFGDPSRNLYKYLKTFNDIPLVPDEIDPKRRNELRQSGKVGRILEFTLCSVLVIFFAVIFLCAFFIALLDDFFSLKYICTLLILGLMLKIVVGILLSVSARFRVDSEYVYVKFLLHKEIAYRWDEFQQVCICYSYITGVRGGSKKIIICFVKHGVKRERMSNQWPTENGLHYKKVPFMRYTQENLEEVKKYCPHEIVDLRGTNGYHH